MGRQLRCSQDAPSLRQGIPVPDWPHFRPSRRAPERYPAPRQDHEASAGGAVLSLPDSAAPSRDAAPASDCPMPPDPAICRFHPPRHDQIRGREAVPGRPPHSIARPRHSAIPTGAASAARAALLMMAPRREGPKAPPPSPAGHHRRYRRQARSRLPARSRQASAPIRRRPVSCQSPVLPSKARHATARAAAIVPAAPIAARHEQAVPPHQAPAPQ
jgi:hypothetical protein